MARPGQGPEPATALACAAYPLHVCLTSACMSGGVIKVLVQLAAAYTCLHWRRMRAAAAMHTAHMAAPAAGSECSGWP